MSVAGVDLAPPPGAVVRFEPRGAAIEMLRSKATEILMSGAAGTGKSVPCLMKLHLVSLAKPGARCLIVRKTLASLGASTLVSFRERVAKEAIDAQLLKWFGGSSQEAPGYRYQNGAVINVGGLDQPTRLLSTEYDIVFVDEAIEVTVDDVETILSRLRNGKLSYQQLIMATNPDGPTHHLKARERDGRLKILYSKHEDNPLLYQDGEWTKTGRGYLDRLENLSGARYHRLRWGRWVASEGMIYEAWDPGVHVIDPFPIPDTWTRWWSVDFGYTNPMVIQCWAEDGDGRLYLYRELYLTKRTVEENGREILAEVADLNPETGRWAWREPRPRAVICDHDAEGRVVLSTTVGLGTIPAKKGVADGIQAVQKRLKPAGDGRPRLFIMRNAVIRRDQELADARLPTCTEEEFPQYIWRKPGATAASQAPKEEPLKENDHGMDALRYLCNEREMGAPRIRSMG
ncbi:phage terminase large subunit [Frankia sp. Mgl5]|uniref:phage terminase large subunit n=1 Tax=Frankia sp. Mgl5 TaxID=2933793 RepID=UPI00200FC04A|nr:phage terminase large subunit [Frankia sp. Mgl5]MCK9929446.1 phage terminase large subunit [Frankia sp. Mgl5]